jgi:raffinose/stachyose/melibiose transport system permease protein
MEHLTPAAILTRTRSLRRSGASRGRASGGTTRRRISPRSAVLSYLVLTILAVFSLGPILIFIFDALKSQVAYAQNPISPPSHPLWSNFERAWTQAGMGAGLLNSLVIIAGTAVGVCVISGCAAYAMTRLDLPGANGVMLYLLMAVALPIQFFLVPLFYLWTRLHLYDTLPGLIIIYCAIFSPFATLLLRSFMLSLPRDYDAAARTDGANEWQVFVRIILPLTWPGFLTAGLVSSVSAYNEFLLALTFIQTPGKMPVVTTLFAFQQGYSENYPLLGAAGLIMLVPMIALFLILQRKFVDGMTSAGLGGA